MANKTLNKPGESFIMIDFSEKMHSENFKVEMYQGSLSEQYSNLLKQIPDRRRVSIEDFLKTCFPAGLPKNYYISCPNFIRQKEENKSGTVSFLKNLVIRPEMTPAMRDILPDNQNVFIIGDIVEGERIKKFTVKGMELIDENMCSPSDIVYYGPACIALNKRTITNNRTQRTMEVSDFGERVNFNDSIFTPENVDFLIRECYTVSKPAEAIAYYETWMKYFESRQYYIDFLQKQSYRTTKVTVHQGYSLQQHEYRSHKDQYRELLINGDTCLERNPILSKQVPNSTPIAIIEVYFEISKQQYLQSLEQGKKSWARSIRRVSNGPCCLFVNDPATFVPSQEKGKKKFNPSVFLDQRIGASEKDIFPEDRIKNLREQVHSRRDDLYKNVEARFNEQAAHRELNTYLANYSVSELVNNGFSSEVANAIYRVSQDDSFLDEHSWKKMLRPKLETLLGAQFCVNNINIIAQARELFRNIRSRQLKNIRNNYAVNLQQEKERISHELNENLEQEQARIIASDTKVRLSIYFMPDNATSANVINNLESKVSNMQYFAVNVLPEKTKLDRQQKAIDDFYRGYVKNPYLSTYLFSPEELVKPNKVIDKKWEWFLDGVLNEKQQEAVRKSVESNGLFLLQGPPGTGKTQVIAEIVAQLVMKGKKILISSETHKAIDNVFDRLPKLANIVPVRLIPEKGKSKDNLYDPRKLVYNFYTSIRSTMQKSVHHFENFARLKENFRDEMQHLQLLNHKIESNRAAFEKMIKQIDVYDETIASERVSLDRVIEDEKLISTQMESFANTKNLITSYDLRRANKGGDDVPLQYEIVGDFIDGIKTIFDKDYIVADKENALKQLFTLDPDSIRDELNSLNPDSEKTSLELRREEIKRAKAACLDEFDEVLPEKRQQYDNLQKEFKQIVNALNEIKSKSADDNDGSTSKLKSVFSYKWMLAHQSEVVSEIQNLRSKCDSLQKEMLRRLAEKSAPLQEKRNEIQQKKKVINSKINELQYKINDLNDSDLSREIQKAQRELGDNIKNFFKDFNISVEYNSTEEAFRLMQLEWKKISDNAEQTARENREKIPMYRKIIDYLDSDEVVEQDTKEYTDDLFESANVYGITCTSRENFRFNDNSQELLGLDSFNLKGAAIDVVIIDEVSKSSFVDLLIPIMYGKTVILVGDHRQLNPMYDLAKMRDEDFEDLDWSMFNKDMNKQYTAMYEISFFKKLFENISDDYKVMLNQQYRCHENIMDVFNHFYRYELKLGYAGQNENKQHGINLNINGNSIIRPDKSVYFINCRGLESKEDKDATSFINEDEANVVIKLITQINNYFLDKNNNSLEKLSMGVISTYGAQASKIKRSLRGIKLNGFIQTPEEKPIVSTVDDFQGDERDIIFLTMVRNNRYDKNSPEFIKAYQRINVALSRARKLLIIVGNRDFLIRKGIIDLPDVHGQKEYDIKGFRVYEKIIGTIESEGKILDSSDILPKENNNSANKGGNR